jgi:glycosyltransferase involved in cell wall biosynthesis
MNSILSESGKPGLTDNVPCLAVVMPAYNEAATIADVVRTVLMQPLVLELIIVDDGSTDGTWLALQTLGKADSRIRIFRH